MVVIGVDPGISGALCVLTDSGVSRSWKTPFILVKDRYARPVLDLVSFTSILDFIEDLGNPDLVMVEASQIRMKTNSRKAVSGIWWYAGILDTALRVQNWKIEYVQPKQWQEKILHPFLKSEAAKASLPLEVVWPDGHDEWKETSIRYVQAVNPSILIPYGSAVKKPHEGAADAFCIAQFALNGEYHRDWIHKPTKASKIRRTKNAKV